MKSLARFLYGHIFIVASGMAAIVHSVWSLDVTFAGMEVSAQIDLLNALFRKLVALLIAIAIDVGQIATAYEIKSGHKSKSKYLTFFSFALATYLLQFYYMIHHVPQLELAGGVRPEWIPIVKLISDAMIWVVPALLPLSTLLYTFSQQSDSYAEEMKREFETRTHMQQKMYDEMNEELNKRVAFQIEELKKSEISSGVSGNSPYKLIGEGNMIWATCPECDWKRSYPNEISAKNGLSSHKPYCKKTKVEVNRE